MAGPQVNRTLGIQRGEEERERILDSKATNSVIKRSHITENAYLRAATEAKIPATLRATKNKWHVFHTAINPTAQGSISA